MSDIWRGIWRPMVYAPGMADPNKINYLPQPTSQFDITWGWKRQTHELPRRAGAVSYGPSAKPTVIQVSGQVYKELADSSYLVDEESMAAKVEALRAALNSQSDTNKLELFAWYDADGSDTVYRKFKQVWCDSFVSQIGDNDRVAFAYNMTFTADDPELYTTAPGA